MAKSQQTFNKSEKEKKRRKKKQDKMEERQQRKLDREKAGKKSFEDLIRYVDEDGNLTSEKPDPLKKKKSIKVEDVIISVPPRDDTPIETVRTGTIKFFNNEKGYGFIIDSMTKDSIFVHMNNAYESIKEGDHVSFEVEMGPKGPNASDVKLKVKEVKKPTPNPAVDKTEEKVDDKAEDKPKSDDTTAEEAAEKPAE